MCIVPTLSSGPQVKYAGDMFDCIDWLQMSEHVMSTLWCVVQHQPHSYTQMFVSLLYSLSTASRLTLQVPKVSGVHKLISLPMRLRC